MHLINKCLTFIKNKLILLKKIMNILKILMILVMVVIIKIIDCNINTFNQYITYKL